MKYQKRILQGWKLAAVVAVALSMGACAKNNVGADGAMASAATPGSQQDFVVNVGNREYNIALGARRAQSVRSYLASRGIDANRMRTISYGKERPVAVCNDISCWSQNRRAVTVLNAGA